MSIIKEGFCSKLTDEFDSRMKQLGDAEKLLDSKLKDLRIGLDQILGWSPHWAINKFKRDIEKNASAIIPSLDQFDELIDLANKCVFAKNNSMLSKPSVLSASIKGQVKANSNQMLGTLASGIPSEFSAANLVGAIKTQLKTSNISIITSDAYQILGCMSAICGVNISARANQIQSFLSKYHLTGTGDLDVDVLLASQGIGQKQIDAIKRVAQQIEGVEQKIEKSFVEGRDRLSKLKKYVPGYDD